jgi:uncharacterized protein
MIRRVLLVTGVLVAAGAPAASAHVTIQPSQAPAGAFTVLNVRVPNERDDAATTKVDVRLPDGFAFVSYQRVPGWTVKMTREKAPKPLKIEGLEVPDQVKRITFTGHGRDGRIGPGEFQEFPLSVRIPDGTAGAKLTFKALQTYSSGEVVRWIGAPDADEPAPQLTLTAAAAGEGGGAAGAHGVGGDTAGEEEEEAPPASTAATGDGDGTTLAAIALAVGALGLTTAAGALLAARRATRRTPA